jgi:hypothetical protein
MSISHQLTGQEKIKKKKKKNWMTGGMAENRVNK